MPLPALTDWSPTATTLHRAATVIGALRLLRLPHMDHYLEVALKPTADGFSTDVLPGGTEIILNCNQQALRIIPTGDSIPLEGHNQQSLLAALLKTLAGGELAYLLADVPPDQHVDRLFETFETTERPFIPARKDYTDTTLFTVDAQHARDYATALSAIYTGVACFRARLTGFMTPIVVWPEHFDLSFLWFKGSADSESEPHMNFGFAPFSDGLDYPYLYAYTYPMKDGYAVPTLPNGARWHTEGWTGVVLPYDVIAQQTDPVAFVEAACLGIYQAQLGIIA